MKALILAAGRGKRLMPYTSKMPKPLVNVQGRPLLDYILLGLRKADISDAVIVVRHLGDQIMERYGDGTSMELRIEYVRQDGYEGTGSAVLAAAGILAGQHFLLLWGDVLMDVRNYRRIREAYYTATCDLLSGLNWLDDLRGGAAVSVQGDRIIGIEEKPTERLQDQHWNQAGLFVCGQAIFSALGECSLSPRGEIEFTSAVERLIANQRDVRWMPIEGFWSDVGTPEALERLEAGPPIFDLLSLSTQGFDKGKARR